MTSIRALLSLSLVFGLCAVALLEPAEALYSGGPGQFNVSFVNMPPGIMVGGVYHGATIVRVIADIKLATVVAPDGSAFLASVATDTNVRYVSEDVAMQANLTTGTDQSAPHTRASGGFLPNDPLWNTQYAPNMIRADRVWNDWKGSAQSNLCIVDSGLRYTHEDIDDNYKGGLGLTQRTDGRLPTDPWDDVGHGTVVAGIAAAGVNNAVGMAGVGNVGLYAVKVLDNSGPTGSALLPSVVAEGVNWCAKNAGPRVVISMSLGVNKVVDWQTTELIMRPVHDAIKDARARGAIIVAATGNNCAGDDCVTLPGRYPEVLAVGCLTTSKVPCVGSNAGPKIDLTAPGYKLLAPQWFANDAYNTDFGGSTSFATPHVAGAIALAWSKRTACSGSAMEEAARLTAEDLGATGRDNATGEGMIDAYALYQNAICGTINPSSGKLLLSAAEIREAALISRLSAS